MELRSYFGMISAAMSLLALPGLASGQEAPELPSPPAPGIPGGLPQPPGFAEFQQQPFPGGPPQLGPRGFGGPGQAPGGPGFGQGPFQPPGPPMSPEMARKTASIMALRRIHGLRLSAENIRATIPILKRLHEAEKEMAAASTRALDEELQALLSAGPDSNVPGDSGDKMRRASQRFRDASEDSWSSLAREIGEEKAGGIQSLLMGAGPGPMGPMPPFGPGGPGGGFGPPGGRGFGEPGGARPPEAPGIGPGRRGLPGQPGVQGRRQPDGAGAPEPPRFPRAEDPQPAGRQVQPGRPGARFGPEGGVPGQGPRGIGQGPGGGIGPGLGGPMWPMGGPRLSLADLIDLLSQKLAAMGR